jgi:hypothetical protein
MSRSWPRTGKAYRIPGTPLPPQAGAPMVLALFHFSWWTVGIALAVCAVFGYASYKNRTILWAIRRLRSKMRSGVLAARPRFYRQRFTFDQPLAELDFKFWGK